jgi:DNA-binding PadR family transcriptional regulator
MSTDKNLLSGNTTMLILKLLEEKDMYGYQIIEELSKKSKNVFQLKTGTLYPLLHSLEKDKMVVSYDKNAGSRRVRNYYSCTVNGKVLLVKKQAEWAEYANAVGLVMDRGMTYEYAG